MAKPVRSAGALELAKLGISQPMIATAVGTSQAMISQWCSGKRKPNAMARKVICDKYEIDIQAWDETPKEYAARLANVQPLQPQPIATASIAIATPHEPENPSALIRRCTTMVERLLNELDATDDTKTRTIEERAAVLQRCMHTLIGLGKGTGAFQELDEKRILASPHWQRIKARVVGVLRKHPDVAREVVAELREMGE